MLRGEQEADRVGPLIREHVEVPVFDPVVHQRAKLVHVSPLDAESFFEILLQHFRYDSLVEIFRENPVFGLDLQTLAAEV